MLVLPSLLLHFSIVQKYWCLTKSKLRDITSSVKTAAVLSCLPKCKTEFQSGTKRVSRNVFCSFSFIKHHFYATQSNCRFGSSAALSSYQKLQTLAIKPPAYQMCTLYDW